jgi:hypothetical protein
MNRKSMLSKVFLAVAVALLIAGVAAIVAQPGPGAGPGGRRGARGFGGAMGLMMYLERAWAAVHFELEATDEQIAELKPIFQSAYDSRKAAIEKAQADQDRQALMTALQQVQTDIDAALQDTLTEEQLAEWEQVKQAALAGLGLGRPGGGAQPQP